MSLHTCCSCAHIYEHMPMPMVAFRFSADASGVSTLQLGPHTSIVCSGCSAQTFVGLLPVHAVQHCVPRSIDSGCSARTYVSCLLTVPAVQFSISYAASVTSCVCH